MSKKQRTDYPLMKNQLGIYYECQSRPDVVIYHMASIYELDKNTDIDRLKTAIIHTINAHPYMKTTLFVDEFGNVRQRRNDDLPPVVIVEYMTDAEYEEKMKHPWKHLHVDRDPLYRTVIYKTETKVTFLMQVHHIMADGLAMLVFMRDLKKSYMQNVELKPEEYSGFEAALEEEALAGSEEYMQAKQYYADLFAGVEVSQTMPPTKLEKGLSDQKGVFITHYQSPEKGKIDAFCKEQGISPNALFTAAFGITLQKFQHIEQAVFSTIHNGRNSKEKMNAVCMFTQTLPVVMPVKETVSELLIQLENQLNENKEHTSCSFIELCENYGINSDFQFAYQGKVVDRVLQKYVLPGGTIKNQIKSINQSTVSAFTMQVMKEDTDGYRFEVEYKENLYHGEWVESFLASYEAALTQLMEVKKMDEIDLFCQQYHEKPLYANSGMEEGCQYDTDETILSVLEKQRNEQPEHLYVVCEEHAYTYKETDEISERIAAHLESLGVGDNDVVAVMITRNEYMVLASIGIMKTGAAYQPLDTSYPEERLSFMVNDSKAKVLITERGMNAFAEKFAGNILYLDEIETLPCTVRVPKKVSKDARAVLLYTSGSTGTPKGVELLHRNLIAFCHECVDTLEMTSQDRYAAYASYGFDVHMMDLYAPMVAGASTHIIKEETRLNLQDLNTYYNQHKITIGFMTTQVARQFVEFADVPSLRHFMAAGEALLPVIPRNNFTFWNMYGPTECTVYITSQKVDRIFHKVPIGKKNANLNVYVIDHKQRQVPYGAIGELLCAGPQVARGYIRSEDSANASFIVNPFTSKSGYQHAYRTGDLVRLLPDGTLEFFGRSDKQVKIRGFRIELTEIEEAIRTYPDIQDATVTVIGENESQSIVAYVVSAKKIDSEELKAHIREQKPHYMVPDAIIQIEKIPLNQNQKVDKRALPKPEYSQLEEHVIPPENDTQRKIRALILEVTGREEISITSDIFENGVTSIGMMRLIALLAREFHVNLNISEIKKHATIVKLEQLLSQERKEAVYQIQADYPLMKNQLGIYVECMNHPEASFYHIPLIYEMSKRIEVGKLEQAVRQTIDAHPYLKTTFFVDDAGAVRQRRQDDLKPVITVEQMSDQEYKEKCKNPWKAFDLIGGALYQAMIYETETKVSFLFQVHHVIADGTSMRIFLRDLEWAYGKEKAVETERFNGFEAALLEEKSIQSEAYEQAKEYYAELFKGVEIPASIGATKLELGLPEQKGICKSLFLLEQEREIEAFCREKNISENVLFTVAYGITLQVFQKTEQAVFTTVYHGRKDARLANTFCMLVKTLPVCMPLEKNITKLLSQCQQLLLQEMEYDMYSFAEISATYGVTSDLQFVYQGDMLEGLTEQDNLLGGKIIENGENVNTSAISSLLMQVNKNGMGQYTIEVEYKEHLYHKEWVESFIASYKSCVLQLMRCGETGEIQLFCRQHEGKDLYPDAISESRAEEVLVKDSVISLFEKQVEERPDNVYVVYGERVYTYKEADEISERIAGHLESLGVGEGNVVGVMIHRNEYMVLAALGIMKTGAVYQPLDPSYPEERLSYMVKDSNAKVLITERERKDVVKQFEGERLYLDEIQAFPSIVRVPKKITPEMGAAILYTSGSTGTPKGVELLHKNFVSLCMDVVRSIGLTEQDRYGAYASYSFDAHIMDLYAPMAAGASTYILDEDTRLNLHALNTYYKEHKITASFMTTQVARQFYELADVPTLRNFMAGGEELVPIMPRKGCNFWNIYGPTECTTYLSKHKVDRAYSKVPLGKANANLRVYVVDEKLRQVPYGAIGELICAGPQVAKGYRNEENKAKSSFIENPFTKEEPYAHAYRTGDFVRLLPDGTFEFYGRMDRQVKIRGFRIELSEIEAAIRTIPDIEDATVAVFGELDNLAIAAYIVSSKEIDVEQVKACIQQNKPSYMVPDVIMQIDKIPLTANHKVDKRALPKPERKQSKEEYILPKNAMQEQIRDLILEVTGKEELSITADIFEEGLTSISAMRLLVLLANQFDVDINIRDLRQHTTVEKLEQFLLKERIETVYEILEDYPLMQNQLGIYIECQNHPDASYYHIPFLYEMDKSVDVVRLEQAVRKTINAHPYMKTVFFTDEMGNVRQRRQDDLEPIITVEQMTDEEYGERRKNPWKKFNLNGGALYEAMIYRTETKVGLFFQVHHAIADGTSIEIFLHDLEQCYLDGTIAETEVFTGFEAALEEEKSRQGKEYEQAKQYYAELLGGVEINSQIPATKLEKGIPEQKGDYCTQFILQEPKRIEEFCKRKGISENVLFTAAYGITVQVFQKTEQAVFTTIYNGRKDAKLANTFCMLVKTLPVCIPLEQNIAKLLKKLQQQMIQGMEYDMYSFAELSAAYGITADLQFAYQGDLIGNLAEKHLLPGGKIVSADESINTTAIAAMLMQVIKKDLGQYEIMVEYKENLYHREWVESFVASFQQAILQLMECEKTEDMDLFCAQNQGKMWSTDVMTRYAADEKEQGDYPLGETIVSLFAKQVVQHPDNIYVVSEERAYTYKQADEISERIAGYLEQAGVGDGQVAAVMIHRNEYMALAPLGILKAGAAYQPLDSTYPEERLSYMVKDSKAKVLITEREFTAFAEQFDGSVLYLDEIETLPDIERKPKKISEDARYVLLYTSGSTGKPKGVELLHKNLIAFCYDFASFVDLQETDRFAAYASFGFDVHMIDLFPCILKGASLYIVSEEKRLDLNQLNAFYQKHGITIGFMTTQVARQFYDVVDAKSLRHLLAGGEALLPVTPRKDFAFWNIYGPTECTVYVTKQRVDRDYDKVPIGKINEGMKAYVIDEKLRQVPYGAIGELLCAGPQVAKGYLGKGNMTQASFLENPFTQDTLYAQAYRTGDLVRLLPDGTFEFFGRKDKQVKIRGFRIELSEIEVALGTFPDIKEATVTTFGETGHLKMAAYIVSDRKIDVESLKSYIRQNKPSYMVPDVIMQIDAIPLTPNQKVDKKALPKPVLQRTREKKPLESRLQMEIADLVSKVIGNQEIGADSDLFELGLSSIQAMQMLVLFSNQFHVNINFRQLRQYATPEKLEAYLIEARNKKEQQTFTKQTVYPLTQTQLGILAECIANPDKTIYNIPCMYRFCGHVDMQQFKKACMEVLDAHPYLKMTIEQNHEGDFVARRRDTAPSNVQMVSAKPNMEELVTPFSLLKEPLYRIVLFDSKEEQYVFMDFHHIIFDGTSLSIFLEDLEKAYKGESVEQECYSGFDIALEEEQIQKPDACQEVKSYYDNLLKGCETNYLPAFAKEEKESGRGISIYKDKVSKECIAFCEEHQITMNAFFMTAFGFLISKYKYMEDAVFTTIYHGRNDSRMKRTLDMLVKTLPMYLKFDGEDTILEVCKKTGEQYGNHMEQQPYSFAQLSRDYGIRSDLMFCYQGEEMVREQFAGVKMETVNLPLDTAKMPISLNVCYEGETLSYILEYDKAKYSTAWAESFLECYQMVVSEFRRKSKVKEISILSEKASQFLASCNDTAFPVEQVTANILLERQVKEHPDKVAVTSRMETRTYKELNENANRIAAGLRKHGVKEGEVVALMLPRCVSVYEAREGILKAGGAFLFLSPDYKDERIRYILEDSKATCLIATEELINQHKNIFSSLKIEILSLEMLLQNDCIENPTPDIVPESIAYCIYTSGSTGKPKGVLIQHKNLVNYVNWNEKNHEIDTLLRHTTVALAITAFTFDVSLLEECVMLYNGFTVCMADDEEIHNPYLLAKLMLDKQVDAMIGTPAFLATLIELEELRPALSKIHVYNMGGESFTQALLRQVHRIRKDAVVLNVYGPTETTIACTATILEDGEDITIGKPLSNMEMYTVDRYQHPLPVYVPGELLIAGDCVGKGYMGMPEETKEKFVHFQGKPAYHSGDLAYWRKDGKIAFLGRMDQQVKLRGLRVELGEIETVLCSFSDVQASIVVVRGEGTSQYLCGYFTANSRIDKTRLTKHLTQYLTDYMVPKILVQLDAFPLNSNGKVDKKALPEPQNDCEATHKEMPKTKLEETLSRIFAMALKRDDVSVTEDFFALGGTSLLASKVVMKCIAEGLPITYADIFTYKNVLSLEAVIMERQSKSLEERPRMNQEPDPKVHKASFETLLSHNQMQKMNKIESHSLGIVLLTGATGFLGIHVLKECLENSMDKVYCLVRGEKGKGVSRLRNLTEYYFNETFWDAYANRIEVVEGDITKAEDMEKLKQYDFDTVINCAACVKHFAKDTILEQVNVQGVANLIELCKSINSSLVQISTISIAGEKYSDVPEAFCECDWDIGQTITNAYVKSKFEAEQLVLQAMEDGLSAKIIRVGNLMGRQTDGKFQINADTNGFLGQLRGYVSLKRIPFSLLNMPIEFSPIDMVAKAVVLCSKMQDSYCVFHAYNPHTVFLADVMEAFVQCGYPVEMVSDGEFQEALQEGIADEKQNNQYSGLIRYMAAEQQDDNSEVQRPVEVKNQFTTKLLYLGGFHWPITDLEYLKRFIKGLEEDGHE